QVTADTPVVLHERLITGLSHVHRRQPGLALHERRQTQQEAGQRLTCAIVRRGLRSEAVGELVVAAILKEPEHVPLEVAEVTTDLQGVLALDPRDPVADLQQLVVVPARRAEQGVSERLVPLDVEVRQSVCSRAAESDPLYAQLADQ